MALLGKTQTAEQRAARLTARLSARAGNIRDLLRELSQQRRTSVLPSQNSEQTQSGAVTKEKEKRTASRLTLKLQQGPSPAPGQIITSFGEKMPSGIISKGIFIETRSSAAVVAPIKGRVVFAGIFRGYGNLVILELPNKGHALIAGMVKVSAGIGDEVLAGEPIGEMAPSNSSPPKLYFELRRKGRPINPLPPKAAHRNKVRG
ncbi:MAG: peptidoglycan DD-metalloendopeptidase family protein [Pseudomonadota bacterium]|nr:peptidoglycan DD-metalloendopeptidase family protein [Pseudomonadota bacterium]